MSALRRHGIERLSPSSLNLWVDSPGLWSLRYLAGLKEDTGAAQARGLAVEAALLLLLHGRNVEQAKETALNNFLQNLGGEINEDIEAEQELIEPMIDQLQKWKPPGKIIGSQMKVEHWLDGVSVPLIGYVDFIFEGPLLDLKTTKRIPSEPKPDHTRQVALYMTARQQPGKLLYVSDKRHAEYEIDEKAREEAMNQLHSAALSLERFLSKFSDSEDAIRCLPMNYDSFRFSDQAKLRLAELRL